MAERTLTEHGYSPPSQPSRPPPQIGALIVASPGLSEARAVEVAGRVTLGRDEIAGVTVDDAGVSREHLGLESRQGSLWLRDLGSHNGTFLNGKRLDADSAEAKTGSVVRLGRTVLVVCDVAPYFAERPAALTGLLGGAALDDVRRKILAISHTKSPVLVLGETGAGKEVVARLLHEQSGRVGPFVALNCAALPTELVDAELFGHAKGAFSGANTARGGQFRAANDGSLFLDEIGEMPLAVQAKLLRALETEEVRAVGEDRPILVDVRVIAATNRDIDSLLESGEFRADLLHRLAGFRVLLPPLRDRREDIAVLAASFAAPSNVAISAAALELLMLHSWPGNVRELRNITTAALHLARQNQSTEVDPDTVSELLSQRSNGEPRPKGEKQRVTEALIANGGDVSAAATQLGMSRSMLYETLKRFAIEPRAFRRK